MTVSTGRKRFHLRGFTSLLLAATGLLVAASGLVLFLAPRGSVARDTAWTALGLDRWQWAAVHVDVMWFFLAACVLHVVFNARALGGYLRDRARAGLHLKLELIAVVGLAAILLTASLLDVFPFGRQGRWADRRTRAAHRHARQFRSPYAAWTIEDVSRRIGSHPERTLAMLARDGYRATSDRDTVGDLARRYGVRPRDILDVFRSAERGSGGARAGRGRGWRRSWGRGGSRWRPGSCDPGW